MERELVCAKIFLHHISHSRKTLKEKGDLIFKKIPTGIFHHRRYFSWNKKKSEKICNLFWQTRKMAIGHSGKKKEKFHQRIFYKYSSWRNRRFWRSIIWHCLICFAQIHISPLLKKKRLLRSLIESSENSSGSHRRFERTQCWMVCQIFCVCCCCLSRTVATASKIVISFSLLVLFLLKCFKNINNRSSRIWTRKIKNKVIFLFFSTRNVRKSSWDIRQTRND